MLDIHQIGAAAYSIAVDGDSFRYTSSNEACLAITNVTSSFTPGLTPHDIFAPAVADDIVGRYRTCVTTRAAMSYVTSFATPSEGKSWRTTLIPMLDADGVVTAIVGICSALRDQDSVGHLSLNDHAALALGAIDGGYWVYEVAEDHFSTSRSLAELIAGPGHETLHLADYLSFVHSEDLSMSGLKDPDIDRSTVDYRVITFDGRMLWLSSRRRVVRDDAGRPIRVVGLVRDISQDKATLQALETQATTDSLTKVKNRGAFDAAAAKAFGDASASGKPMGIILMDLDGFKPINDELGHRAGDEILRAVARRLARFVRKSDCLARMGGDEFAILMRGSSAATGEPLALRVRQAFAIPFTLGNRKVFVRLSTGVAVSCETDRTVEDVAERADRALYEMKRRRQLQTA